MTYWAVALRPVAVTVNEVLTLCGVVVELPLDGLAVTVTVYVPTFLLRSVKVVVALPLALSAIDELDSVAVT